jgi:hypothetical protein
VAEKNNELAALIGLADYLYYKSVQLEPSSVDFLFTPYLSVDHYSLLKKIIPDIDEDWIEELAVKAKSILEENEEIFAMIAGKD